jgi:general transcriptional corepressor TUP1
MTNSILPFDNLPRAPELQRPQCATTERASSASLWDVENSLMDLNIDYLPPEYKKQKGDWFAVFNPNTPRVLDVDLVHTLPIDGFVFCVKFSYDGKYVATGCNRSAQIFDVNTGSRVS